MSTTSSDAHRARRRLPLVATMLVALLAVLVVPGVGTGVAAASQSHENEFLDLLNGERSARGLPRLVSDPGIVPIAREWSASMAARNTLEHRGDLKAQTERRVTMNWQRLGENVGRGGTVGSLHKAFMDSPGHHANVVGDYNRIGVGVVVANGTIWVTFNFMKAAPLAATAPPPAPPRGDFRVATADGDVRSYGSASSHGSLVGKPLARPIVGMTQTPSKKGYWLVASDGGVFSFGDARFYGSTGGRHLNQPIVGMEATRSGRGYWLVAADGGIFSFGDAAFHGSTGGRRLNSPVLGMARTPLGTGYWLVAADGGIFSFGGARFLGSTGGRRLNAPVTAMEATHTGRGYWLLANDGGVFSFGDARFLGSAAGKIGARATDISRSAHSDGYTIATERGAVVPFGTVNASSGELGTAHPVVAVGYWH